MAQEKLLQDFSGGMNALAAVDKLDPKECLLAENCRLDETGNIQSAGAFTHQNTSPYAAASGTNTNNVHSLFWNPSLGGVAGVGQDVFIGPTLGGLASKLAAKNANRQKMSFASAPNRVYFDVGSVGYWTDMTNLLLVDWAPPSAASAVTTGPNAAGTFGQFPGGTAVASASGFGFSLGAQGMQGVVALATTTYTVTVQPTGTGAFSGVANGTLIGKLYVGGGAVGTSIVSQTTLSFNGSGPAPQTFTFVEVFSLGSPNNLWGYAPLSPAQVNASNFGFQFMSYPTGGSTTNCNFNVLSAVFSPPVTSTVYQGAGGFTANTGAAGALTGTYVWKITFVAANGEESDGSIDSTNVILSAQQGTLTAIPTGDARTTSRNVYRKGLAASTGLTLHYLVGSIPDNTTTTYSDNMTDLAALTEGVILAGDVPGDFPNSRLGSTQVRFPVYHYDRVFWVNQGQQNQIIWSKPLDGFAYPAVNSIDVGDSKPITRLVSIFGELIIVKTDSIWRLTGADETSFDLTQTPSSVGTDESFSVVTLPDKIIFANRWGLWVFNGYTSQPLTTKLDLWFKQEDRSGVSLFGVNGFHPPEVSSSSAPLNFDAVGNNEKFYFAYAEAGQPQNNALLVFDVKHGNITKREPGTPLPLSLAIDPVTGFVYMGEADGFVSILDDWTGATGGGTALNFDFQHGYQDFQRGSNKSLWALEFFINTNGQSLTPYVYYDQGLASETLAPIVTTGLQRVVRTMQATNSRKMQNFSWRLNGSLSVVNANGTPQIEIVHVKVLYDLRVGRSRTGQ